MKKQRTSPYGYCLQRGEIRISHDEAKYVKRIFEMYANDGTITSIADYLNTAGVPYSKPSPLWDKHKVKRILENPVYTGTKGFPDIISEETFHRVRTLHSQKTEARQKPSGNSDKPLWEKTYCAECGERMPRVGAFSIASGLVMLICKNPDCGNRVTLERNAFRRSIASKTHELHSQQQITEYEPSQSVLRMTAEIHRQLDKPSDEKIVQQLILQAAAERYACCPDADEHTNVPQDEIDWRLFKKYAERIEIASDGSIEITGK